MGNGIRPRFFFFFFYVSVLLFLFAAPYSGTAQTPPDGTAGTGTPPAGEETPAPPPEKKPVATMPFLGDDLAQSAQLRSVVVREVEGLAEYTPRHISSDSFPETLDFRPDEPPDPKYLGEMPYVLTGEYYFDTEDLGHFQLWLWNSADGSLVYTDELVAEDIEEAESYLPALVSWVFSRIPPPPPPVQLTVDLRGMVEEVMGERNRGTETGEPVPFSRLYLGMRVGGAVNAYYSRTTDRYDAGMSQGFGGEAAFMVEYRPWRYLSFLGEAVFSLDVFKVFKINQVGNQDIHTTSQYTALSVYFPLMIKTPIEVGPFSISLFAGAYYILPLGQIVDEGASYSYRIDLPLGLMVGMDMGHSLGPGDLFVSLRYGRDLGMTMAHSGLQYTPNRVALSVGYRFGFLKGKRQETRLLRVTGTGTGTATPVTTGTGTETTGAGTAGTETTETGTAAPATGAETTGAGTAAPTTTGSGG
ncbi:MAG: hypothetical protein LBG08_08010 [Spirochaetaceae bacterium]|nr:hypothetical protein [Spirochaetaceae bacterium]